MALGKGVPRIRRSVKRFLNFFRNFLFAECLHRGTRQRYFKKNSLPSAVSEALGKVFSKKKSLSSARSGTLGKEFFFKKNLLCRVPDLGHSTKKFKKNLLCRVSDLGHSAKKFQKKIKSLPSARSGTLGKEI